MGMYVNPDNEGFKIDSSDELYVDKTGLIQLINKAVNTNGRCIALSHARRFGKSQAARMLRAYYSKGCDSRGLFEQFGISRTAGWDKYLNKFNVIYLDMSTFAGTHKEDLVDNVIGEVREELREEYPAIDYSKGIAQILGKVYKVSGTKLVIIIDEWDCVIRNHADRQDLVHRYMQLLHDMFKSDESAGFLALGYITGILPVKKIADESALNNFREYTMLGSLKFTPYYGFTGEEVEALCHRSGMDFEAVRQWYDGYLISSLHMYNPNSVYQAIIDEKLASYWRNTSAFGTINRYIGLNMAGLKDDVVKMLSGERIPVNTETFQNDLSIINSKDDALTALIHLGYLSYDELRHQAFIPNYEVSTAFQTAIRTSKWPELVTAMDNADKLLFDTIDGRADCVAKKLDVAHDAYASVIQYNNENAMSCVLSLAYATAPAYYNVEREMPTGKGFADLVFLPRREAVGMPAMVIELKFDKSADTAIGQIKEKRYAGKLKGYADKIMLVGISYDKKVKRHSCVIEEYPGDS